MTTIDPTTVSTIDLARMLRVWASGVYATEAAVGRLIAHGTWLRRPDFLAQLVDAVDDGWGPRGEVVPMAAVDWDRVHEFAGHAPASSSELAVLRLAASLAGAVAPVSLRDMTVSLDDSNSRHVVDAVLVPAEAVGERVHDVPAVAVVEDALAHRFGWHEYGVRHTVTGHQVDAPTRTVTPPADPLPTFEELRVRAYKLLGDAADCLRTDYERGSGPTREALAAVHRADRAIAAAKTALNEAAALETERAQRMQER